MSELLPCPFVRALKGKSDEELATLRDKAKRAIRAYQAAEFADLAVARYEAPSMAADRAIDRGSMKTLNAQRALRMVEEELWFRANDARIAELTRTPSTREKVLVEALTPFAKIEPSSLYADDGSEAEPYSVILKGDWANAVEFTGTDLARARTALSQMDAEVGNG